MAARDRYGSSFECTGCGAKGSIKCSENDYPFMKSLDFQIDALEGPFEVTKMGETSVSTDVICISCKIKVW